MVGTVGEGTHNRAHGHHDCAAAVSPDHGTAPHSAAMGYRSLILLALFAGSSALVLPANARAFAISTSPARSAAPIALFGSAKKPAAKKAVKKPVAKKPVAKKPVAKKPVRAAVKKPVTKKPASTRSAGAKDPKLRAYQAKVKAEAARKAASSSGREKAAKAKAEASRKASLARKKKLEAEANARKARAKAYTDAQFDARRTAGLSFDFRRSVLGYSSDKVATIERRQRKAAAGSKYGARWG